MKKRASVSLLMIFIFFLLLISILSLVTVLETRLALGSNRLDGAQASYYAESLALIYFQDPEARARTREVFLRLGEDRGLDLEGKSFGPGQAQEARLDMADQGKRDGLGRRVFEIDLTYAYKGIGSRASLLYTATNKALYPESGRVRPEAGDPLFSALVPQLGHQLGQTRHLMDQLEVPGDSLLRPQGKKLVFYREVTPDILDEEVLQEEALEEGGEGLEDPGGEEAVLDEEAPEEPPAGPILEPYMEGSQVVHSHMMVRTSLLIEDPVKFKGIVYLGPGARLEGGLDLEGVLVLEPGSHVDGDIRVQGLVIDLEGTSNYASGLDPALVEAYLASLDEVYEFSLLRLRKNLPTKK